MHPHEIDKYLEVTKKIFNDCFLENGCIIGAPTDKSYYPKDAKSYFYSWPGRDAGFALAAMTLIGNNQYDKFLNWIWNRAECFHKTAHHHHSGLIYRSYHPNGLIREHHYQPDQGSTLIWSIDYKNKLSSKKPNDIELKVIKQIADGYCSVWEDSYFNIDIEDIWEERRIKSKNGFFTYSLAACMTGMKIAYEYFKQNTYLEVYEEMHSALKHYLEKSEFLPRAVNRYKLDTTPDASFFGLIWPFDVGLSQKTKNYILEVIKDISKDGKIYRYPDDKYQGADGHHNFNNKAGSWPLLSFWHAIALKKMGLADQAEEVFNLTMSRHAIDNLMPEQVFTDGNWIGVKPLLWAQIMPLFYLYDN